MNVMQLKLFLAKLFRMSSFLTEMLRTCGFLRSAVFMRCLCTLGFRQKACQVSHIGLPVPKDHVIKQTGKYQQ